MKYVGEELELFQHARNWKRYYSGKLKPYVRGKVLDAGCGMGVNSEYLFNEQVTQYTFLEPDGDLLDRVPEHVSTPQLKNAERIQGTSAQLNGRQFDTILYLDVIEHIEDSKAELRRAYDLLVPGGHLLIVVPAFNFLYSEFDKAIGHYRRYDKEILKGELPTEFECLSTQYLDSLGMVMSLGNKLLLRRSSPKPSHIRFWDTMVVPVSRIADRISGHAFGRSLLAICRKPMTQP